MFLDYIIFIHGKVTMFSFRQAIIMAIKFCIDSTIEAATAPPRIPYCGINQIFNNIPVNAQNSRLLRINLSFPDINNRYPTDPVETLTNCPIAKIINTTEPCLNCSPNIDSINSGISKNSNNAGDASRTMIFADFIATELNAFISSC